MRLLLIKIFRLLIFIAVIVAIGALFGMLTLSLSFAQPDEMINLYGGGDEPTRYERYDFNDNTWERGEINDYRESYDEPMWEDTREYREAEQHRRDHNNWVNEWRDSYGND